MLLKLHVPGPEHRQVHARYPFAGASHPKGMPELHLDLRQSLDEGNARDYLSCSGRVKRVAHNQYSVSPLNVSQGSTDLVVRNCSAGAVLNEEQNSLEKTRHPQHDISGS